MRTRIKTIITMMFISSILALSATACNDKGRIVVISDTHLLAPALVTPGSAIDRADAQEMKMMAMRPSPRPPLPAMSLPRYTANTATVPNHSVTPPR